MTTLDNAPYDALERIFHEPNRLAIVSAVCAAEHGLAFNELRDLCGLTDGNLNRHLKVLQDAGAVTVTKAFVHDKPRTTIAISRTGLRRFNEYLDALAAVLKEAQRALPDARARALRAPNPLPRVSHA